MTLTKNEAIEEAISSLDYEANTTYEGSELDDPDIMAWKQKKIDAIAVLRTLTD